ncbi:MAG: hypothetical protein J5849_07200, partial [Clostridia bacterium]|nr:hypothetical protein [Clostridia bacterium]
IEIEPLASGVTSALVRPLSLGIEAEVEGNRISFEAPSPSSLTVEFDGRYDRVLHLFLNEPDEEKPDPDSPGVRYFGPGIHRDVIVDIRDGETVYLDDGCLLYGQLRSDGGRDFAVRGHGVLCGSVYDRWQDTVVPVDFSHCRNFTVRDVTILDPAAWTFNLFDCEDGRVDRVRIVSARSNSDGLTFQTCRRIAARNAFVRSWDDCLVVKGYGGDVEDILFENCVLWTDLAQSCEVGYETRADLMKGIRFKGITVLHNFHKPVMSVHNSDRALVRDVLFEDVTVEDAEMGEGDGTPWLLELTTTESQWSRTAERGSTDGVTVRRVNVLSGKRPGVRIVSANENARIDHVTISGLTVLGEKIASFDQLPGEFSPYNGPSIGFADEA